MLGCWSRSRKPTRHKDWKAVLKQPKISYVQLMEEYKLRSKFVTETNPDCIKVCPFDRNIFCIGHYQQIEGQNTRGAISILDTSLSQHQITTVPVEAILHLVWLDTLVHGRMYLVVACRNSAVKLFQYVKPEVQLKEVKTISIDSDHAYCLYIDAVVVSAEIHIIVSTNKSDVVFLVLDSDMNVKNELRMDGHEYAVWCCRINPFTPQSFLSGDEILNLIQGDIREDPVRISKNSKIHQSGISDICFTNRQYEFLTGTFDGSLRWFDTRNIHKPVKQYKAEGVVWRIVPEPTNSKLLLCLSSVNRIHVLDIASLEKLELQQHQSLAYAADWTTDLVVSASFYDKLVCIWEK